MVEATNGGAVLTDKERKLISIIQKQDRMLYLCFYMLLNLAEDVTVERKMRKKNIVPHLIGMLERSNVELLILAVTFLKKLSIYKENKDQMVKVLHLLSPPSHRRLLPCCMPEMMRGELLWFRGTLGKAILLLCSTVLGHATQNACPKRQVALCCARVAMHAVPMDELHSSLVRASNHRWGACSTRSSAS